jgi:hypothetical protein
MTTRPVENLSGELQYPTRWRRSYRFDYCRTVFYINTHTELLTAFFSSSSRYSFRGATPGMSSGLSSRRIHVRPYSGCLAGFSLYGHDRHADFFGDVVGGHTKLVRKALRIDGGHLADLELESNLYPVGLLFC